jgi:hypothetical protein
MIYYNNKLQHLLPDFGGAIPACRADVYGGGHAPRMRITDSSPPPLFQAASPAGANIRKINGRTMNNQKERIKKILTLDAQLLKIFKTSAPLEEKRVMLRNYLSNLLLNVFDESREVPPLEWIICRDATWVLRNILAPRSEELAGFSFIRFIDDVVNDKKTEHPLTPDFIAELHHLVKGVIGTSGIYKEKPPAFLRHSGRKAAKLRSLDLSRMARKSARFLARYPSGLDDELVRERSLNRTAILKHCQITDLEWNDWRWHVRNIIRDADTMSRLVRLSESEKEAITLQCPETGQKLSPGSTESGHNFHPPRRQAGLRVSPLGEKTCPCRHLRLHGCLDLQVSQEAAGRW